MWKNKDVDRISLLPDCLLHDILSSLQTKQVVQTCVLSKRWKTLWTHIPTLNFDFDSYPFEASSVNGTRNCIWLDNKFHCQTWKETSFKRFILSILSKHPSEYIRKLSYSHNRCDESYFVKNILSYPQFHRAQELYITMFSIYELMWPCLSACKLLTVLKITCRNVTNMESLVLPSLRILEIKKVLNYWDNINYIEEHEEEYHDGYYENIPLNEKSFSGCLNLESLVLLNCLFKNDLFISAPKLENLELNSLGFVLSYPKVEFCTPNLKSIKFRNIIPYVKSASDYVNIEKVSIAIPGYDFKREEDLLQVMNGKYICELLKVFHNVVSLTLPCNATEVIFKLPYSSGCCFPNLRQLKEFKTRLSEEMIEVAIGPNTISNFIDCPNLKIYAVGSTITSSLSQLNLEDKL